MIRDWRVMAPLSVSLEVPNFETTKFFPISTFSNFPFPLQSQTLTMKPSVLLSVTASGGWPGAHFGPEDLGEVGHGELDTQL